MLSGGPTPATPRRPPPPDRAPRRPPAAGGRSPDVVRGHTPRDPLATPSRRWRAAQTARVEARPAARPAQNGTRRPPQCRRAAETVNVNGRDAVDATCWCKRAPGAKEVTVRLSPVAVGR